MCQRDNNPTIVETTAVGHQRFFIVVRNSRTWDKIDKQAMFIRHELRKTNKQYLSKNVWHPTREVRGSKTTKATNESEMTTNLWMAVNKWRHKGHTQQAGCSLILIKVFNISVHANPCAPKNMPVFYSLCSFNAILFCWEFSFLLAKKWTRLLFSI